jgi:hypothetical protein
MIAMPMVASRVTLTSLGTASALIGVLALQVNQSHYLAFGLVLCAGGAVLALLGIAARRFPRPSWWITSALGLAGLLLSLFVVREDICCMYGYHRGLGYPWGWLDMHTSADALAAIEAAKSDPRRLDTSIDILKVILDGLFWWHVALLAVVPLTQVGHVLRRDHRHVDPAAAVTAKSHSSDAST